MGQQARVLSASLLAVLVSTALTPCSKVRAEPSQNAIADNFKRIIYRPGAIPPRPGDLNADGFIDTQDLLQMVHFLSAPPLTPDDAAYARADLTGDGIVDERDLTRLLELLTVAASPRGCPSVNNCCAFPIAFGGCCDLPGECIGIPGPGGGPDDPEPPEGGGGPGGIGGGGGGPGDGGPGSIGNPPGGGNGGGDPPPPECGFYITVAYPFEPADPPHSIPQIPRVGVGYIDLRAELTIGQFVAVDWYLVENGVVPAEPTLRGSHLFTIAPDSPGQYEVRAKRTCGEDNSFETGTTVDIFWANPHSVSFGGANHLIRSDPRPGVASFEYAAPHWKDDDNDVEITPPPQGADRRYPIAYTRGATVTIDQFVPALTMDERSNPPATVYYKAIGPGGQEFTIGRTDENQPIAAPEPLDNTIAYHANYPLSWKVSFDGQRVWYDIGSTGHEMYVTLDTPFGQRYETMYHIATTSATGNSERIPSRDATWAAFQSLVVHNKAGHALGYYRGGPCADPRDETQAIVTHASQLISITNGQCGAWVQLFANTMRIHGYGNDEVAQVSITPDHNSFIYLCGSLENVWKSRLRMMIQNWSFQPNAASGCATFPYRLNNPCDVYWDDWATIDVTQQPGLAGQDMLSPVSIFQQHILALIDGQLYDPSYGRGPYPDVRSWKNNAIAGFATTINLFDRLHGARPANSDRTEVLSTIEVVP